MVVSAKQNVDKIQVQPITIASGKAGSMMGFDYRGSINIKKHIVHNKNQN